MSDAKTPAPRRLPTQILSQIPYAPYGDVIAARADVVPCKANLGSADRFNFLAPLVNLRPEKSQPNLCFFRCEPMVRTPQTEFSVRLLERHLYSTQVFIPMRGAKRYLVIVCLGADRPDLSTVAAFLAHAGQGISYRPGVWHHPLVAMDEPSEFSCLVFEDGTDDDCEVLTLTPPLTVEFAKG